MTNEESLIQEVRESIATDLEKRQPIIEKRETEDKLIQQRITEGEIGVSLGADNVTGLLMFLLSTFFTLLAIYIVFEVNPAHYQH